MAEDNINPLCIPLPAFGASCDVNYKKVDVAIIGEEPFVGRLTKLAAEQGLNVVKPDVILIEEHKIMTARILADQGLNLIVPEILPKTDTTDLDKPISKVLKTNEGEVIPEEKVKAMKEYAYKLLKKHPQMSTPRLQRKVAEYFKIKLT